MILTLVVPVFEVLALAVIIMLSVNVKIAKDMKQGGWNQQVVMVTMEDGTQQAMTVQEMN